MRGRGTATAAALLSFLSLSPRLANACWPGAKGSDPRLCKPNDPLYINDWNLWGYVPDQVAPRMNSKEAAVGAIGMSVDRAWQISTGRDDVVIAVLDSGILWNEKDLVHRIFINRGELPLPQGSASYDANQDGVFDVRDYEKDPLVGDRNGNGLIDGEDLIAAFSNGRDEDGNGYVDDISGYDFFIGDNNPKDDNEFGHGTNMGRYMAAEGNDGFGMIGVCPKCRILPVRVGDSFVVEANRYSRGVMFALRSGIKIVSASLGSVNDTPTVRKVIDYAFENGVALQGAAADEYSYHHNFPMVHNHVLVVNSIRHDHRTDALQASTFWGLNGCSNFGARVQLSVPSIACASEATSRASGVIGLLQSVARTTGIRELSPGEAHQIVTMTADDLVVPEWNDGRTRFPAKKGFDEIYGNGRLNALRSVERVAVNAIPPEADLETPDWFDILSPRFNGKVDVIGSVRISRAQSAQYSLEYALGVEPRETDYVPVASGRVARSTRGVIGILDFSRLPVPTGPPPRNRTDRDRYSVTLRLRVTDNANLRSEARRSFFVLDDPTWAAPPMKLPASGDSGPVLYDLNRDGRDDLIVATSDGSLRIFRNGLDPSSQIIAPLDEEAPVDPLGAIETPRDALVAHLTVGDLFGDGDPKILVTSYNGKLYVFDSAGDRVSPFPIALDPARAGVATPDQALQSGYLSSPVLADLDRDGEPDIITSSLDGHVYAWRNDGSVLPGFPVPVLRQMGKEARLDKIASTPAVADLDGDGFLEIVVGTNHVRDSTGSAFALHHDGLLHTGGPFVSGWNPLLLPAIRPDLLPTVAYGAPSKPVPIDVNRDGRSEILVYAATGRVLLVDGEGRAVQKLAVQASPTSELAGVGFVAEMGSAAIADTNHDGKSEAYAPLLSLRILNMALYPGVPLDVPLALGGWDLATGRALPGWPRRMEDIMIFTRPAIADVDGDAAEEILMSSGGYLLHAFNLTGEEADTFPKFTGGWMTAPPAVGDLSGDGQRELIAATREGYLFSWNLPPAAPGRERASSFVSRR